MVTQLIHDQHLTTPQADVRELARVLGRLRWRLGLERLVVFAMRGGFASALVLSGLAVAAWLVPVGTWPESAWIAALPLGAALLWAVLRWPSDHSAALVADRRLALDERLGTAFELARRAGAGGRFDHLQVHDAVTRAHAAPRIWLALDRTVRRDGSLLLGASVLAGVALLLPGLPRPTLGGRDQVMAMVDVIPAAAALDQAQTPVADLTAADTPPIQPTPPDANLATRVAQAQAEQDALGTLAQAVGGISAGQAAADAIQRGDFQTARDQLAALGDEADQLSDAAKQQLSAALQQAASATAATDRPLADRERQAAQALGRNNYADQRQALRNLADQVPKSGAKTTSADQLARDVGRLQQQAASAQGTAAPSSTQGSGNQSTGAPGVGTGTTPDVLGDQPSRLDTAGQRVEVPTKLGAGPGVRPPDGTEDQTGLSPAAPPRSVSEFVQAQQTGHVAPEQNLVPGEQRPVVRGYFR